MHTFEGYLPSLTTDQLELAMLDVNSNIQAFDLDDLGQDDLGQGHRSSGFQMYTCALV